MSFAADLIRADGDVVVIPLALARKIGLSAAAFLRQAAYLSAIVEQNQGWFFLDQEGEGNPYGETIFQRLGSWESALGLGTDAQSSIRKKLINMKLLEETRKGMVHGKLLYRVDPDAYIKFLASCSSPLPSPTNCSNGQTGNPDCTNGKSGLNNRKMPDDIYKVDIRIGLPPPPARDADEGGSGVFKTAPKPNTSADAVHVFLDAAANPEILQSEIQKLSAEIAGASDEQAKLAGFAWLATKDKSSPVGLAVRLCRLAASGTVTQCALAVTETKKIEKDVVTQGFARLRALHGKKYRTQNGKTARIDLDWIYLDEEGAIAGHEALVCLRHIEEGNWLPLA